jgi:hypothetical protein
VIDDADERIRSHEASLVKDNGSFVKRFYGT